MLRSLVYAAVDKRPCLGQGGRRGLRVEAVLWSSQPSVALATCTVSCSYLAETVCSQHHLRSTVSSRQFRNERKMLVQKRLLLGLTAPLQWARSTQEPGKLWRGIRKWQGSKEAHWEMSLITDIPSSLSSLFLSSFHSYFPFLSSPFSIFLLRLLLCLSSFPLLPLRWYTLLTSTKALSSHHQWASCYLEQHIPRNTLS